MAPENMEEAVAALHREQPKIIAGCTDFYPSQQSAQENLLDVSKLPELQGITRTENGWRLGAATTWREIIKHPLPPAFHGLKLAAREVGSLQILNRGTVAGNICNASPAADGVPPLLALDAQVEITSAAGTRVVPLGQFITGVRAIDLAPHEMVSAIHIPHINNTAHSAFTKLGSRAYLVISIVMVAAVVDVADGVVREARVAVGACSPVAQRLPDLESALVGMRAEEATNFKVEPAMYARSLSPIDDVRGSGAYRMEAVAEVCARVVGDAVRGAVRGAVSGA